MLRLPPHRGFPCDAEPGEVFMDGGLEFRLAAGQVDVLDAQQQAAAGLTRQVKIQQRRKGVAEMQITVRARRKAEDGGRHRFSTLVIAGLDPAIHPSSVCYDMRWMRGSSPRMTPCRVDIPQCSSTSTPR